MKKHLFTFILIVFPLFSVRSEPLATFDGGVIELSDIHREGSIYYFELEMQRHQLTRQILINTLKTRLIDMEKTSTKKNYIQLIHAFIESEYNETDAKDLKELFSNTSGGSPELDPYSSQEKINLENKYLVSLIKKYHVAITLQPPEPPTINLDIQGQPFQGKEENSFVIVEFADFECPYCKKMQADIHRIVTEYPDKVKWVFIDYPLEFHRQSLKAHIAARCAGDQKKYFEYQKKLFEKSPQLGEDTLQSIAKEVKLDEAEFSRCLMDEKSQKKNAINANVEYGRKLGISGTPTLFFNGKYYPGLLNYLEMKEIIDQKK